MRRLLLSLPLSLLLLVPACTQGPSAASRPAPGPTPQQLAERAAQRAEADAAFEADQNLRAAELYEQLDKAAEYRDLPVLQRHIESLIRLGAARDATILIREKLPGAANDPTSELLRGYALAHDRKAEEALRKINGVLAAAENEPRALYFRAAARMRAHQFREAIDDLQRVIATKPSVHARLLLARAYRHTGQLVQANGVYREALAAAPPASQPAATASRPAPSTGPARRSASEMYDARALVAEEYSEYLLNLTFMALRIEARPTLFDRADIEKLRAIQPARSAVQVLGAASRRDPRNALWLVRMAQLALLSGDEAGAVSLYREALRLEPDAEPLVVALAEELIRNRAFQQASELLSRGIEKSPTLALYLERAECHAGLKDPASAREDLRLAADRARTSAEMLLVAGRAGKVLGAQEARAFFEALGKAKPNDLPMRLAVAETQRSADDPKAALTTLGAMPPNLSDEDRRAWLLASAEAHQGVKDLPAAVADYKAILAKEPDDIHTLNNLAYLLADDLKGYAEALPHAERLAFLMADAPPDALSPSDNAMFDTIGYVFLHNGRLPAAEAAMRQCLQLQPSGEAYLHMAQVYKARDKLTEAREAANRAMDQPDATDALRDKVRTLLRSLGRDL